MPMTKFPVRSSVQSVSGISTFDDTESVGVPLQKGVQKLFNFFMQAHRKFFVSCEKFFRYRPIMCRACISFCRKIIKIGDRYALYTFTIG